MNPPSPTQCSSSPSSRATVEPTGAHYSSPDPRRSTTATGTPPRGASDDPCVAISDVDAFARTIAAIRSKPQAAAAATSPSSDHLASVLSHYAARWLPDVAASSPSGRFQLPPESPTATWLKRLLLESSSPRSRPTTPPAKTGTTALRATSSSACSAPGAWWGPTRRC
ncbi:hypothetical protein ZWY2020_047261 [Hordeum vulgare]|nr:hypothetical protein ZWY2020_047261 [Hordeum vulgare]